MAGALVWFAIAYFAHQSLISYATGARGVTRAEAPKLYNVLENLCISRGLPMPALQIIDTPALNAYASGLHEGQYVVAVTRGPLDTLADDELEAVLAHELTHIRNRDTQLMVIAVIFAGIFAFFGDLVIRGWDFPYGWAPRSKSEGPWGTSSACGRHVVGLGRPRSDGETQQRQGRRRRHPQRSSIAVVIILITWGVSTLIRLALSRSREYLADAGSAELTKNPDALVRALRKIETTPLRRAIAHGGILHRDPGRRARQRPFLDPPLGGRPRRGVAPIRRDTGDGTRAAITGNASRLPTFGNRRRSVQPSGRSLRRDAREQLRAFFHLLSVRQAEGIEHNLNSVQPVVRERGFPDIVAPGGAQSIGVGVQIREDMANIRESNGR